MLEVDSSISFGMKEIESNWILGFWREYKGYNFTELELTKYREYEIRKRRSGNCSSSREPAAPRQIGITPEKFLIHDLENYLWLASEYPFISLNNIFDFLKQILLDDVHENAEVGEEALKWVQHRHTVMLAEESFCGSYRMA
jgi:hypothetical protein